MGLRDTLRHEAKIEEGGLEAARRSRAGLTAKDRTANDKALINAQGQDTVSSSGEGAIDTEGYLVNALKEAQAFMPTTPGQSYDRTKRIEDLSRALHDQEVYKYENKYHIGDDSILRSHQNIQDVAAKVSPQYQNYAGSYIQDFTSNDWGTIAANYEANRKVYGDTVANQQLDVDIKHTMGKYMPFWDVVSNAFLGAGADFGAGVIELVGELQGTSEAAIQAIPSINPDNRRNPDLGYFENLHDITIDNPTTRLADEIRRAGGLHLQFEKDANSPFGIKVSDNRQWYLDNGVNPLEILKTEGEENSLFTWKSPFEAISSSGFTAVSMAVGAGEAKLADALFTGAKGAVVAGKTGETLLKTRGTLEKLQKAQNFTNKFVIPGLVGTLEGGTEALSTKIQFEEQGTNMVNEMHSNEVAEETNRRLEKQYIKNEDPQGNIYYTDKSGNLVDVAAEYTKVWNELEPKYQESLRQVEVAATRAGINNFWANSLINGTLNATLKAGLQAAPVRKALQNSKVFGWAQPKSSMNISGEGANVRVKPRFTYPKAAWYLTKEPIGEFTEEYLQSVSDATARGGAENNIHEFLENKYHGDGLAVVGDSFASDWGAASAAFTNSMVDKETLQSGIYGALGSIIGTVTIPSKIKTGKIDKKGKPIYTRFGRGVREDGKKENGWDYISRLTPWRSGAISSFREMKEQLKTSKNAAEALQEWMRDPNNKGKFDGVVGSYNWALKMGSDEKGNDEFGYRNSVLGKTINDALMLNYLKGTKYYDSYMKQLIEVANLEEGSEEAANYIKSIREGVSALDSSLSDSEVLKTLKGNANKVLSTIDKVQQESDRIERLLGNVDVDTKQSLIYGQIMQEDWAKREKQLKDEINSASAEVTSSREHSTELNSKQKAIIAKYGSVSEAQTALFRLQEKSASLAEDIKNLKGRKNISDKEKKILAGKKAQKKTIDKELKSLEELKTITSESSTVLNEQEIMELDPIERALMLKRGKEREYNATHLSAEAQQQKEQLENELFNLRRQREQHLDDSGRVKKHHNKQVEKIDKRINKIQSTLKSDTYTTEVREHFSPEQQAVIDNLITQASTNDKEFLEKVIDLGRITNARRTFAEQYNAILRNSSALSNFAFNAQQTAKDVAIKKRYEAINDIKDYVSFAQEMDNVQRNGSDREVSMISRALAKSKNPFFEKYHKDRTTIGGIFEQLSENPKFQSMDSNDMGMLVHTLEYLADNNVDYNDENAVVAALSKRDEDGILSFKRYVEKANRDAAEVDRTMFTSVGEAFNTFKDVMQGYVDSSRERAANNKPVVPGPTSPQQSNPPVTPEVTHKPSPFMTKEEAEESARKTAEGGQQPASQKPNNQKPNGNQDNRGNQGSQSGQNNQGGTTDNSEKTVVEEALDFVKGFINTLSSNSYPAEVKAKAAEIIDRLNADMYQTASELSQAIIQKANQLDISSDDPIDRQVVNALKRASVQLSIAISKGNFKGSNQTGGVVQRPQRRPGNPNSSIVASSNIATIKKKYPNSPIAKYWRASKIEEFLKSEWFNEHYSDTPVYFISDNNLAQEIAADMQANGANYTVLDTPIIAVVPYERGTLIIDGKHYQPIGTFPSTNNQYSSGAINVGRIRDLVGDDYDGGLIKDAKGNPLTTTTVKPTFDVPGQIPKGMPNKGAVELAMQELTQDERESLEAMPKAERRGSPVYQAVKQRFLRLINPDLVDHNGNKNLALRIPTGKGTYILLDVWRTSTTDSRSSKSDKLISELFNEGNVDELLQANFRLAGAASKLEDLANNFFDTTDPDVISLDYDDNGKLIPTGEFAAQLARVEAQLNSDMANQFSIATSYKFTITPSEDVVDGKRMFNINLVNTLNAENDTRVLGQVTNSPMTKEQQFNILKNLIMDGDKVRQVVKKNSETTDLVWWQIDYPIGNRTLQDVKPNIANAFDDGMFEMSNENLEYQVLGVEVRSPFTSTGDVIVVNNQNSTAVAPAAPINSPIITTDQVQSNDGIIDSETGTKQGQEDNIDAEKKKAEALLRAKAVVQRIKEESKNFVLSSDEKYYIDKRTGKKYLRVTSVIEADENGDHMDEDNPWIFPSTSIGTVVDTVVRDFFDGLISYNEESGAWESKDLPEGKKHNLELLYPNMTTESLGQLIQQLVSFKQTLDSRGIEIVPKGIMAKGSITITDVSGKEHTLDVAGTVDLLGYDAEGNFYVFDMKSKRSLDSMEASLATDPVTKDFVYNRNDTFGVYDRKALEKWSRQTTLYKQFLENEYGIKVNNLFVIPIQVTYPVPIGKGGNVQYGSTKPGEETKKADNGKQLTQLTANGVPYNASNPDLHTMISIPEANLNIKYERLKDSDRSIVEEVEKEIADQAAAAVADNATSNDTTDNNTPIEVDKVEVKKPEVTHDETLGTDIAPIDEDDPTASFFNDDIDDWQKRDSNPDVKNPMEEGRDYTASEVQEFYRKINKTLPPGYHRLANSVFSVCKKLKIKFKVNPNIGGNGVYHADTRVVEFNSEIAANTLLHEAIHAVTHHYMNLEQDELAKLPKNIQRAVKTLKEAYKEMNEAFMKGKDGKPLTGLARDVREMTKGETPYYGLNNVNEFVAELSNPEFIATIRRYDARYHRDERGVFRKVLDSILGFFGIQKSYSTTLESSFSALKTLLENPNEKLFNDQLAFNKGMRQYLDFVKGYQANFHNIDVKESTLERLDNEYSNKQTSEVVMSANYSDVRRGSVLLGRIHPDSNRDETLGTITLVITESTPLSDGKVRVKYRLLSYKEFRGGNRLRVNYDNNNRPYLTRVRPKPPRIVTPRLAWNRFEGYTNRQGQKIDVDATMNILSQFYTDEEWADMTDEEIEHELNCKGVFK